MSTIYELAKESIELCGFKLENKLQELTSIMLAGQINPFEYDELVRLATEYSDPETKPEKTNILGALSMILTEIENIKERLDNLEESGNEPVEIIPEWERWDGYPDHAYQFGAKVIHLGVIYVSNLVGPNTWEPGTPGTEALWTVVGEAKNE